MSPTEKKNIGRRLKALRRLITLTFLVAPMAGHAGTVQQVGITNMITESELVIHGEVISRSYEFGHDQSQIYTRVLISVIDIIKGQFAGKTIELKFLGGTIGRRTLTLSDQFVPTVGDEAVYFIENLRRPQVNPLYGWRQGHFPVRYGEFADERFALTHDLQPIYEVLQENTPLGIELTKGVATGISVKPADDQVQMTVLEFKNRLREIAARSR